MNMSITQGFLVQLEDKKAPPAGNRGLTTTTDWKSKMANSDCSSTTPAKSKEWRFNWTMAQRIDRWIRRSVTAEGECWTWTGAMTRNGYGQLMVHGVHHMAHRAFYAYFIADIPDGLDLDHLCRNRACVNPWHLDPVTRAVNLGRGDTRRTHFSSRTHCPHGHEYDRTNTYVNQGKRACRACARIRAQARRDSRAGV